MSTWTNHNEMIIGSGFPHTNQFILFLIEEAVDGIEINDPAKPGRPPRYIRFNSPMLRSMIEMLEEGFHSGTAQEFVVEKVQEHLGEYIGDEDDPEGFEDKVGKLAASIMVQNFKDLILIMKAG